MMHDSMTKKLDMLIDRQAEIQNLLIQPETSNDINLLTELNKEFADNAIKLCRAGRPPCPLCGAPIDMEGHICPRHNGHAKLK